MLQLDEPDESRDPTKTFNPAGQPQCLPRCEERYCGSDDCGGSCGNCPSGRVCVVGQCICSPNCADRECGIDGCGGACGTCAPGQACGDDGRCAWLTKLQLFDVRWPIGAVASKAGLRGDEFRAL